MDGGARLSASRASGSSARWTSVRRYIVGYAAARSIPVSRARALIYALIVVAVAVAVLWVKSLVPH
jgi:hypothetical protein